MTAKTIQASPTGAAKSAAQSPSSAPQSGGVAVRITAKDDPDFGKTLTVTRQVAEDIVAEGIGELQ